jgi:hypothetical protein
MQPTVARPQASAPTPCVCQRVAKLQPNGSAVECLFSDGSSLALSRFLGSFVRSSDQIEFDPTAVDPVRELRVVQNTSRRPKELYCAPIGYVTQPKRDKRDEYFLRAAVTGSRLGVRHVHLPNAAVRDYFYFSNRRHPGCEEQTLYDLLRTVPSAGPVDLRLALKVRLLELQTDAASKDQLQAVERAFNLLARPDLRSCYQTLLLDPDAPALFPYGGFGALLVAGELSPDRETFFAKKILSFLPDRRERRFRAPLRKVEFFDGHAVYRDSRRKAEVILDQISLPLAFDPTWNQWRHLIGTKIGVEATFVKSGKYRFRNGEWCLVDWETALPSRLRITLPGDTQEVLANARKTYHRFGEFFDAIQKLRVRLEREPLERTELDRICDELRIPQVSTLPKYRGSRTTILSITINFGSVPASCSSSETSTSSSWSTPPWWKFHSKGMRPTFSRGRRTSINGSARTPELSRTTSARIGGTRPSNSASWAASCTDEIPEHGCGLFARRLVNRWTTHSRWMRRLNELPCAAMVDSFPFPS